MPTVSIITPLYNRLDLVPQTWASIKAQSFDDWEWIVVDDGSTDGGVDYIEKLSKTDSRIHLLNRKDGIKGPSSCRNKGVEFATGKLLIFLDSDDLIVPHCLEKRVGFLNKNDQLDFAVFTQATFQEEIHANQPIFTKYFSDNEEYLNAFISDQHPWQTSGPLWKKESFITTGGFREDYTIMEDPELHIRALLTSMKFKVIKDEPDFFYRLLPKTPKQEKAFWHNSIIGRIRFYQDLLPKLTNNSQFQALRIGIINLYKTFLLSRVHKYPKEQDNLIEWIERKKILSPFKVLAIKSFVFIHNSPLLSKVPFLKGLVFKLI